MKQILHLIFFSLLFFQLPAQVSLVLDAVTVSQIGNRDDDAIIAKATVTNESTERKLILWQRNVLSLTEGWGTAICDKNICYDPSIEAFEFELDAGESGTVNVYGYPGGLDGRAKVELTLTDSADPNNTVSAVYDVRSEGVVTSTTNISRPNIKIYPNPTAQYISITDATDVDKLIVYNIVGRPVKTFKATYENQYNVGHLPIGMYLVRVVNAKEQTLKTIRLKVSYP